MNIIKKTSVFLLIAGLLVTQGGYSTNIVLAQEDEPEAISSSESDEEKQESMNADAEAESASADDESVQTAANDDEDAVDAQEEETPEDDALREDDSQEEGVLHEEETLEAAVALSTDIDGEEDTATTTEVVELHVNTSSTTGTSTVSEDISSRTASSTTTIVSGTSIALANVLNLVNSNFVNSEGVVLFSNFFESVFGAIDFREYFANAASWGCSLLGCQGEHVAVNVDNNASIDNEILVTANSGENTIENAGTGVINTGDAYAGLNLVNVANTNLVDSNYLLVTLNAFQDINGDIVFPSLSQFFGSLAQGAASPSTINISNTASVNNDVAVEANAGDNQTQNTGSSAISTGNAIGSSNVFNQLNSSLVGGQSISVVFRVHGSWAGEIFGAPDDLAWTAGDDGSIYLFDVGGSSQNGSHSMNGTSTAAINNKVNVIALTGANAITNAETAVISTGNAYAGANIINVANANVVGRNWILAVINIFGDFNGNIAFGRPDLWVGGQVDVPATIKNGSDLGYKLTVINNGDSPASNVKLQSKVNGDYLRVLSATHEYTQTDSGLLWSLGTIPAGGAVEVSYRATVVNTDPGTDIVNTAEVRGKETDNNTADNKEVLALTTDAQRGNGIRLQLGSKSSKAPTETVEELGEIELQVERQTKNTTLTPLTRTAEQKLVVTNDTNTLARNVVLHDLLKDASGNIVRDEVWELGDVYPHEEIELGYTITFNEKAAFGTYILSTSIEGLNVNVDTDANGEIVYVEMMVPQTPLLASFEGEVFPPEAQSDLPTAEEVVYQAEETPLIPPLGPSIAEAASNDDLASAVQAGVPISPIMIFFASVTTLLAFSLLRLYRVF